MAEKDKRYYWLRLKRDFFKRHDIRIIEAMPNGKDYILFYLKLLCESVDHEGKLRFSESIPYNEDMLATITNTNVDVVRSAIKVFSELSMMEIMDDGTYFMNEVERMIGSETYWAEKKRRQKELPKLTQGCVRLNAEMVRLPDGQTRYVDEKRYGGNGMLALDLAGGKCEMCGSSESLVIHHNNGYSNDIEDLYVLCTGCHGAVHSGNSPRLIHNRGGNFPQGGGNIPPDKEKDIDIEKDTEIDKEKDKERISYQQIADMYNDTCVSFPRVTTLSDARKKSIKARMKVYTLDDFKRLFEKAEGSTFLKGGNNRNWSANFDWLIKDSNMAKVLDGNYDDKLASGSPAKNKTAQELDNFYRMAVEWAEGAEEQ